MRLLAGLVTGMFMIGMVGMANADFLVRDYIDVGDGLLTYDESTQLEWLDVTETRALSVNEVLNDFIPLHTGFHHATYAQVEQMMSNIGLNPDGNYRAAEYAAAQNFNSLFNTDMSTCEDWVTCANIYDSGRIYAVNVMARSLDATGQSNAGRGSISEYADFWTTDHSNTYGHFLVRTETPVPEPATMLLFSTGLIGLAGVTIRRRKK